MRRDEAARLIRELIIVNADRRSTMHGVLDPQTAEALRVALVTLEENGKRRRGDGQGT